MNPVFDGEWLEDGQLVVSIANSDVTNKRSEVDRKTYERAQCVIVNDWESVIDNDQTELLDPIKDGIIGRDHVYELGELLNGKVSVKQTPRGERAKRESSITRTIQAWRSSLPRPAAFSIARRWPKARTRSFRPNGWAATCPPTIRPVSGRRREGNLR